MAARKKMIDIPFDIPIPILLQCQFFSISTSQFSSTVLTAGAIMLIKKYGIHLWVTIR